MPTSQIAGLAPNSLCVQARALQGARLYLHALHRLAPAGKRHVFEGDSTRMCLSVENNRVSLEEALDRRQGNRHRLVDTPNRKRDDTASLVVPVSLARPPAGGTLDQLQEPNRAYTQSPSIPEGLLRTGRGRHGVPADAPGHGDRARAVAGPGLTRRSSASSCSAATTRTT